MEIREAHPRDRPAIRDTARRSLEASYSLGPRAITSAINEWYDEQSLEAAFEDDDKLMLVADTDGQVVAFSESIVSGDRTAELLWLHVDPDHRGENHGESLYEATHEHLDSLGVTTIRGHVLADNQEGASFYEHQGLTKVDETDVEIDGETHTEFVYADIEEPEMEAIELDGTRVYIDHNSIKVGSFAPFYAMYTDDVGETLYGHYCGNCDSAPAAVDTMGRIKCDECGNESKPTRWDAAYL